MILALTCISGLKAMDQQPASWYGYMGHNSQALLRELDMAIADQENAGALRDMQGVHVGNMISRIYSLASSAMNVSVQDMGEDLDLSIAKKFLSFLEARGIECANSEKQNKKAFYEFVEQEKDLVKEALVDEFSSNPAVHDLLIARGINLGDFIAFVTGLESFTNQEYLEGLAADQNNKKMMAVLFAFAPERARERFIRQNLPLIAFNVTSHRFTTPAPEEPKIFSFNEPYYLFLGFAPNAIINHMAQEFDSIAQFRLGNDAQNFILGLAKKDGSALNELVIQNIGLRMLRANSLKNLFASTQEAKPMTRTNIFPTRMIKLFPPVGESFASANINSAEADLFGANGAGLTIFRAEELLKTLVHEILHLIGLRVGTLHEWSKNQFAIDPGSGFIQVNESMVEAAAAFFNVLFTAYDLSSDEASYRSLVHEMWQKEKTFGLFQAAKMLDLSGFISFNEFINPAATEKRVKESTAAAEYHILKAALLYNADQFIAMIAHAKNIGSLTEGTQALLEKTIQDPEFQEIMNRLIAVAHKMAKDTAFGKTGRMTIIERNIGLPIDSLE